jgi:hypothetical protein
MTTGESLATSVRADPVTVIPRVLDLGCGRNKVAGAVGVDRNPASQADLLCDLDRILFPFRADSFDEIHLHHEVEHLGDLWRSWRRSGALPATAPASSSPPRTSPRCTPTPIPVIGNGWPEGPSTRSAKTYRRVGALRCCGRRFAFMTTISGPGRRG